MDNRLYPKYLRSPEEIVNLFSGKTLIILDTETTGLYSQVHQVTEIAAEVMDWDTFKTIDSFQRKIALTEKTKARMEYEKNIKEPGFFGIKKCLQLQKYDIDNPELQNLEEVLMDFYGFCENYEAIIVGQNIKFDIDMINTALKKIRPRSEIKNQEAYDTKLFFTLYIIPALMALKKRGDEKTKGIIEKTWDYRLGRPSARLGVILKAFDIEIQGWHGAIEDVKSTAIALKKIIAFIKEYPGIVSDPIFIKERNKAYLRENVYFRYKSKMQRRKFYKRDKFY